MKRNLRLLAALLSVSMLVFVMSSCDPDDPEPEPTDYTPVIEEDFNFMVDGNDVTFTTTLTGNVWFINATTGGQLDVVEGTASVNLPNAGTYPFTCNVLVDGATYTSDTFNVVIETADVAFLDKGLWLALSGGANKTKTWKMDMSPDGSVYFDGPLYYSGYADGDNRKTEWSYWAWDLTPEEVEQIQAGELEYMVNDAPQTSIFNWSPDYAGNTWLMPANDYGTITFDATNGTVSTTVFGETTDGTFTLDTSTMMLTLTGLTVPIDTARLDEGQFKENDLSNLRIFTLKDSSMQIGIKRSFEGGDPSEWVNVYNFIVADYDYPEPTVPAEVFTPEEAVKTSFAKADLVGTWKYADVPQGWVAFTKVGDQGTTIPARLFETWTVRADVITSLESWGATDVGAVFTAADTITYTFNDDGTCTLNGVDNTYTITDGVITFGSALAETEFALVWITMTGTELKIVDFTKQGPEDALTDHAFPGVWFGQKNGAKDEYQCVQLMKQ